MPDGRKILVAFARRCGLDEVHADRAVSQVLRPRGTQQVTIENAMEVLDELAALAAATT